jgi:hypothetical protein
LPLCAKWKEEEMKNNFNVSFEKKKKFFNVTDFGFSEISSFEILDNFK